MDQFYPWFKFYFLLFWGVINYDNEFETKEKKFKLRIKLNHNIYNLLTISYSLLTYFSGWTKVVMFFSSNDVICQYVING